MPGKPRPAHAWGRVMGFSSPHRELKGRGSRSRAWDPLNPIPPVTRGPGSRGGLCFLFPKQCPPKKAARRKPQEQGRMEGQAEMLLGRGKEGCWCRSDPAHAVIPSAWEWMCWDLCYPDQQPRTQIWCSLKAKILSLCSENLCPMKTPLTEPPTPQDPPRPQIQRPLSFPSAPSTSGSIPSSLHHMGPCSSCSLQLLGTAQPSKGGEPPLKMLRRSSNKKENHKSTLFTQNGPFSPFPMRNVVPRPQCNFFPRPTCLKHPFPPRLPELMTFQWASHPGIGVL